MPQMSDLPSARLQLYKPAFHSCGMDCFGPFLIKIGRRTEKHWGVLFKCLTTRAMHLDLLPSLSTDSYLWLFGGSLLGEAPQRSYGQIEGPTSVEASGSCEKHMPP